MGPTMETGWIAGILRGREDSIAEPLSFIGDTLMRRAAIGWAGKEAVIVVVVSAALVVIGWLGTRMVDPEPAVLAASVVLLIYFAHVAVFVPGLLRAAWMGWKLRLPARRLALFFLYRAILRSMERVERAVEDGLEGATWYVRGGAGLAKWWNSAPREQVAWRIAQATAPLMWKHTIRTAALCIAPLLLVISTFRMTVTHGVLLNDAAHLGVLEAAVYPLAALADVAFGTSLRALLKHG